MKKNLVWCLVVIVLLAACGQQKKNDITGPKPGVFVLGNIVLFVYRAPSTIITNVALTGDFFGWKPEGFPLTYDAAVNLWRISITLQPGLYQYKYILNGSILTNDPYNPSVAPDGRGGLNSIVQVGP